MNFERGVEYAASSLAVDEPSPELEEKGRDNEGLAPSVAPSERTMAQIGGITAALPSAQTAATNSNLNDEESKLLSEASTALHDGEEEEQSVADETVIMSLSEQTGGNET
ncbi:hypothetical protein PI124_g22720 [Phytophthora idaei]|nr:hypothetical protein PI125_g24583 [Phytophthora idaei]KAG3125761.1 hypothetical protein PI126_g22622 [Phytophthora idaei]KAG3232192.1 hypothetical protein PI124_g22720 [Phytophthora idaei]